MSIGFKDNVSKNDEWVSFLIPYAQRTDLKIILCACAAQFLVVDPEVLQLVVLVGGMKTVISVY